MVVGETEMTCTSNTLAACERCSYPESMFRVAVAVLFALIAFPVVAVAQEVSGLPEAQDAMRDAVNNWHTAGAMAVALSGTMAVVQLTRLSVIADFLRRHEAQWVRALLAVILAGLTAVVAALQSGASPWLAGIHGIFVGMASVGGHQLVTNINEKVVKKAKSKIKGG